MPSNPRLVRDLMTPAPHTIGIDQTIAEASQRMRVLGVHHLPVTQDGKVVGVLSEREVALIYGVTPCDPAALAVGDVIEQGACIVGPELSMSEVARSMAERGASCCVVVQGERPVGIVTITDLVQLLAVMLDALGDFGGSNLRPGAVRSRILAEHEVLRGMYVKIAELALQLSEGDHESEADLREQCGELYQMLLRHLELEDTILAPALAAVDELGAVRAQQLLDEHERQRLELFIALSSVDESSAPDLAKTVLSLIASLREDMAREEQALLRSQLLEDHPIGVSSSRG